jgi:hypothetical protein
MTQHQLGQKDQARATLARLRACLSQATGTNPDATQAFLRELESVLGAQE